MCTRIVPAGFEVKKHEAAIVDMGCNSALATYWQLRKRTDYLKKFKDRNPDIDLILDSGAYTLMEMEPQPLDYYLRYLDNYVKFLQQYGEYVHAAAELDIDSIAVVGPERAEEWRETIFSKIDNTSIIFVWHQDTHNLQYFARYCQQY